MREMAVIETGIIGVMKKEKIQSKVVGTLNVRCVEKEDTLWTLAFVSINVKFVVNMASLPVLVIRIQTINLICPHNNHRTGHQALDHHQRVKFAQRKVTQLLTVFTVLMCLLDIVLCLSLLVRSVD